MFSVISRVFLVATSDEMSPQTKFLPRVNNNTEACAVFCRKLDFLESLPTLALGYTAQPPIALRQPPRPCWDILYTGNGGGVIYSR